MTQRPAPLPRPPPPRRGPRRGGRVGRGLLRPLLLSALSAGALACAAERGPDPPPPDPWADRVVAFRPGQNAGFGAAGLPDIVLGPPRGRGEAAGSLDVVSLGRGGEIVLGFDPPLPADGPGPDLLVFENPFSTWLETGEVAASEDGVSWRTWSCDPLDAQGGFPGCAGVRPVHANPGNGLSATDPSEAGGDAFDLADLGLEQARFVRIRDTGQNDYQGQTGGFDLDALAVVHGGGGRAR